MTYQLYHGDCIDVMPTLTKHSVDLVLADPPYGTTACKWDSIIPFEPMWSAISHVAKINAAIVMTASQPFTSALIMSNIRQFKYEWVWHKNRATGFLQAKYMPMKKHENICVFVGQGKPTYNPQDTVGHAPTNSAKGYGHSPTFGKSKQRNYQGGDTTRRPTSVQHFKSERGLHPTQKPVALMEYLIKTYTNEGDTVLDFAMGSGTTGVACANTGRKFIGIETDSSYFQLAENRIAEAHH